MTYDELQKDLLTALDLHIDILKEVEDIESEHLPAVLFMMRSFGFMLDRAPTVLAVHDEEEMMYLMFQYYSLLTELKYNLAFNFPYAKMQGESLLEVAKQFPCTYEKELKKWWEEKTGLTVEERKQTIKIDDFAY
ncbi:hypothetical protein [Enterococcus alishanensis]